jgi:hypothetical protein
MLYAVTIEPLNATFFMSQHPDDGQWEVQEDVELEIPFNYDTRSNGAEPPDQILCISVTDPKHYKMFKYKRNVDPGQFKPTGRHFGGVYSKSTWTRFMNSLPGALAVHNLPDSEPPGATDEAVAFIKRGD